MNEANRESIISNDSQDIVISTSLQHTVFPEHWHLFAEILLSSADQSVYNVRGVNYEINQGDILVIWPTELHSTLYSPAGSSILIQFSADLIRDNQDIYMYYRYMQQIHKISSDQPELREKVAGYINELVKLHNEKKDFMVTEMKIRVLKLLVLLAEESKKHDKDDLSNEKRIPHQSDTYLKIQSACRYIAKNCEKNLMQVQVSEYVGFSPYYFSRIFKKYTGESYSEYLTRQRIRKAVEMLSSDNIPITEIGFYAGFQSVSNFNRAFKTLMGCSPTQFRKMHTGRNHERFPEDLFVEKDDEDEE